MQAALIPVAHTVGTAFGPAPQKPLETMCTGTGGEPGRLAACHPAASRRDLAAGAPTACFAAPRSG